MNFAIAESLCLSLLNPNKCNTLRALTQVQALTFKAGIDQCRFFAGRLLLVSSGVDLCYSGRILAHFPRPDSFMFNTLLRGISDSGDCVRSLAFFREIHCRDSSLFDSFTFSFALKSAAISRSLFAGSQLHCRALVQGFDTHVFVSTTLVSFYGECGVLGCARKVFDEMPDRNVVAWNAILTAFFRCGDVVGGEALFRKMPERDVTSWNVVLDGFVKAGELNRAMGVFSSMSMKDGVAWSTMIVGFSRSGFCVEAVQLFRDFRRTGLAPNEVSLIGAISASAQVGSIWFGLAIHGFVVKFGSLWMVPVCNALVDTYSKCGSISMARSIFKAIPIDKRSVVSWSSMVSALASHGFGHEALMVFNEMERAGTVPDEIAFISVLHACSHQGLLKKGRQYFSKMIVNGIEPSLEHYGCMVDMYSRAGEHQKGYEFSCRMHVPPNDVIWRTLLGACSLRGDVQLAKQVRERLDMTDPANSGDHILMSNAYAVNMNWRDAANVRQSMIDQGMKKSPGLSAIETNIAVFRQ